MGKTNTVYHFPLFYRGPSHVCFSQIHCQTLSTTLFTLLLVVVIAFQYQSYPLKYPCRSYPFCVKMAENANPGDYGTLSDLEGEDDGNQPEVNPPTVQQETVQEGEEEEAEDDKDDHEDWTYVRNPKYDHFMIRFMSFKDRTTYPKDVMFTKDQVLAIRPHDVRKCR